MKDKEKAIVMAHTGICTLTGDKFQIFHKYVEDIMGRPVMTHELLFLGDEIKEKSKADFIALCAEQEPKMGCWIAKDIHNCHTSFECSKCGYIHSFMHLYGEPTADYTYCPKCGEKMESEDEEMTCDKCKHFKVLYEPVRTGELWGMKLWDMGRAKCNKHNFITDFANHGKFKRLDTCEDFEPQESEE